MTQEIFWGDSVDVSQEDEHRLITYLTNKLQSIRDNTRRRLNVAAAAAEGFSDVRSKGQQTEQMDFVKCVQSISVECTDNMIGIVEEIMKHCVLHMIQKPPCSFNVVAIGSLARGEATPYSDLEYMFLLEPGDKTSETVEYFESLAIISYFLIGNFRETKLSYMAVDELREQKWFDDKSKNGFKIDGLAPQAGNIPTGNGIPKTRVDDQPSGYLPTGNGNPLQRNHFITTPEDLAKRYEAILHNPVKEDAMMGDLTAMLAYMKTVYSYNPPFNQGCPDILESLKTLLRAISPNQRREEVNKQMLLNDMSKFDFKPDKKLMGDRGVTVDVKKDLYRFPSILVYDLSIVFNCFGDSVWETIELLHQRKHISEYVRDSILFQLACACFVRLSTYLHHDSHDDRVSLLQTVQLEHSYSAKGGESRWPMPGELLFMLCDYMIPLKDAIQADSSNISKVLLLDTQQSDWWCRLQTMYYCGWYEQAYKSFVSTFDEEQINDLEKFREVIGQSGHKLSTVMCEVIGEVLFKATKLDQAERFFNARENQANKTWTQGLKSQLQYLMTLPMIPFLPDDQSGEGDGTYVPFVDRVLKAFKSALEGQQQHSKDLNAVANMQSVFGMALLEDFVVKSGLREAASSKTIAEEVEGSALCVMWNGDAIDQFFSVLESQHVTSLDHRPTYKALVELFILNIDPFKLVSDLASVNFSPDTPPLERLMKLSPVDRLGSIKSCSLSTSVALLTLGVWYAYNGKHDVGEKYIDKADGLLAERYGKNALHSQAPVVSMCRAMIEWIAGRKVEARKFLAESKRVSQQLIGDLSAMLYLIDDFENWFPAFLIPRSFNDWFFNLKGEIQVAFPAALMSYWTPTSTARKPAAHPAQPAVQQAQPAESPVHDDVD